MALYIHARILPNALFALLLAGIPAGAFAQSAAPQPPVAEPEAFGDIVVTAQKREENLQKVGISVTAFSGQQLRALGITDTTQITQQVPGLQLNAWSPNITIFNLRGISQNNFTDYLEAPVAVYLDDAYMGSINGISGQLFDVERVEVLRGPQGTLFGRNATGGLIHYVSKGATSDAFNGYAQASYESYNRRALEGAVGGGLTKGVRFRVAGRVVKADGYLKSADALPGTFDGNGQDLGGENAWALRGTVQIDFGERGKVDLWVKHSEDNNVSTGGYVFDNCTFEANGYCNVDAAGLGAGTTGVINGITGEPASPFSNFSNDRGNFNRTTNIYQAKFSYELTDSIDLTAITNVTRLSKDYVEDGDAIPVTVILFATDAKYRQFSQEVRLSGSADSFRWQAGFYYLDMNTRGMITTVGAPVIGAAIGINGTANNPTAIEQYDLSSKNWSVFGQGEYDISDQFTLIAGLRYSKDTKGTTYTSTIVDEGFPDAILATERTFAAMIPGIDRISYGDWAARVALNYKPNEDTLLFASWNRGIKGGNWTLNAAVTAQDFQHRPETLNALEAGVKWRNTDRSLRLNATLYHYIYDDYQAFALTGGLPQVSNSNARATGSELEAFWQPSPHLNINVGATWQTSSVDKVKAVGEQFGPELFPGAPSVGYCNNVGGAFFCDFPQKSILNAQFPNAPKFSANYLIRYNFDALAGNIAAQFDGVWYDRQYLEVTNGRSSLQPAYNVSNASLTWTSEDERFALQVFGRNIFDQAYRAYTLNLGILGTTSLYAKPRTFGVSGTVKW